MKMFTPALAAALIAAPAYAAEDAAIPDIAQALLNAAYDTGEPDEVAAVAKAVKAVFPDYSDAIDAQAAQKIADLSPPEESSADNDAAAELEKDSGGILAISPWDGKIQASAVFTSGNSDNSAVGVLIDAAREAGNYVHNFDAYFNLGRSNDVTNQKRWGAAYQLDYNFGERTFAYGRFAYDEDQFTGYSYRLFAGAGLGHYFFKSDPFRWKVEGGPGFRYSLLDDSPEVEEEFAVYAASETDWVIRDGLVFEQDFNATWTEPSTTFQSVTSLSTKIWESLSTGVSFEYRHETDPPFGREKTDTIAKASIIYGF